MMLGGKKILVGICGSIAAYKSAVLVRLLVKAGAEVKVIMTHSACQFISPLTLATLSKNSVLIEFVEDNQNNWNNHVDLALWADALVIAPATAHTIGKMANGICDNLLMGIYLSARCPVFLAPAMDLEMYQHPSTKENIHKLIQWGVHTIASTHGELASGLVGYGRMAEPEQISAHLEEYFLTSNLLRGKKALVTAGPTYEAIDPVRFIGNHSTGKMGFAIAHELAKQGAEVELITGPTHLQVQAPGITLTRVTSAQQMYQACIDKFVTIQIAVLSAAVADFKPMRAENQKIKKNNEGLTIELIKTPDIAAELGNRKTSNQCIVGFALETENEKANAEKKMKAKKLDLIVLNSLNDQGAGFTYDTNKVSILNNHGTVIDFELKLKEEVAKDIVKAIIHEISLPR